MTIPAAIAVLVGIILTAGTNARVALGLGLIALAAYLVVTGIVERLQRVEDGVAGLRDSAMARAVTDALLSRGAAGDTGEKADKAPTSALP